MALDVDNMKFTLAEVIGPNQLVSKIKANSMGSYWPSQKANGVTL